MKQIKTLALEAQSLGFAKKVPPKIERPPSDNRAALCFCSILAFLIALSAVHIRTQVILIGYELGSLKSLEINLLEKKGLATANLAKVSTKSFLESISNTPNSER